MRRGRGRRPCTWDRALGAKRGPADLDIRLVLQLLCDAFDRPAQRGDRRHRGSDTTNAARVSTRFGAAAGTIASDDALNGRVERFNASTEGWSHGSRAAGPVVWTFRHPLSAANRAHRLTESNNEVKLWTSESAVVFLA